MNVILYITGTHSQDVQLSPTSPSALQSTELTFTCSYNGNEPFGEFKWERNKGTVGTVLSTTCQQLSINPTLYSYTCPDDRNVTFTIRDVTLEEHMMAWQCKISVNRVFQLSNTVKVSVLGTF